MSHDAIYVAAPALANATLTHSVVATSTLLSRAACSLLTNAANAKIYCKHEVFILMLTAR